MPSENTEQRRLAAIMFTDMVGYSALSQRNEALALELLAGNQRLQRTQFPLFNGREVKATGDGFLVEFPSALQATQCAVEIQRAVAAHNDPHPPDRHIYVRIGIHVGDVVYREADMYGDGVNIAARIEPLAVGGGICLSDAVYAQVRNKLDVALTKLESPELKHIEVPMDVYRVVLPWDKPSSSRGEHAPSQRGATSQKVRTSAGPKLALVAALVLLAVGLGWWLFHRPSQGTNPVANRPPNALSSPVASTIPNVADQKSIAVLPFVNMSGNTENEYFSDGISEEILNALARTPGLRVAARTSAFFFKGKNEPVQKIGEALKVGVVLEGSVRRAGNQLRITAQLINVADGYHLWSDTFDRKAEDIFAIQSEVAQRVLEALKLKLLVDSGSPSPRIGTDNLEAYDLFLRGRELWNRRTAADLERAIGYFRQVTEKDPKFALAYAGLGACYATLPFFAAVSVQETVPKARAAARRALELDSRLAEAHSVLADCLQKEGDFVGAEKGYIQALALNPNYATAHQWFAGLLADMGRSEQALAESHLAQNLDPLSAIIKVNLAERLLESRRYDEALLELDKALELSPDFPKALQWRGRLKILQKKFPDAIADFEKARAMTGSSSTLSGAIGYCYAVTGRLNETQQLLEHLRVNATQGLSVATSIAFVYQGLADMEQVFAWLERAAQDPYERVRTLKYDPLWDEVTRDPRYAALLKKHGLEK